MKNLFLKLKNNYCFVTGYENRTLYSHAVVFLTYILVWLF